MKLLVTFLALFVGCQCQSNFQMPEVYVKEGDDAIIPCQWDSDTTGVPTIKWYIQSDGSRVLIYTFKKGDEAATGPSGSITRAYYVNEDGALVLYESTLQDNDDFGDLECEKDFAASGAGQAVSEVGQTKLHVVVLPKQEPEIELAKNTEFQSGVSRLTRVGSCTTDYVFPKPVVKIFKEGEENEKTGDKEIVRDNPDDDPFGFGKDFLNGDLILDGDDGKIAIKKLFIRNLTKEDDRAVFFCVVETGGGGSNTSRTQKVRFPEFRVKYPTDMVDFIHPPERVFAGVPVELSCKANGYPLPTINLDGQIKNTEVNTIELSIEKSDDKRVVSCNASNPTNGAANVLSAAYTLEVKYSDEPKIEGDMGKIMYGEGLSLMCMGNSKPKPRDTYWEKDGDIISESGDLTIPEVTFAHSGVYTCVVENRYDVLTKRLDTNKIEVVGLVLEDSAKEVAVTEEIHTKTVDLECIVDAVPEPSISWTYKTKGPDSVMTVDDTNVVSLGNNKYRSTINVGPLDQEMSKRVYMCSASNTESGSGQIKTFHIPEFKQQNDAGDDDNQELAQASPTAGIIIGILVAVFLIVVVLVVLARKGIICNKKGEDGDEDAKDIAMKMNKDEEAPPPRNDYNEVPTDHKVAENDQQVEGGEEEHLVNGTGDDALHFLQC